ncbi:MAG: matrixin family metalloprotease, partial [Blastocatellia bacterium]
MKHSILKPAAQVFALLLALLFAANIGTATTAVMLTDEELIASSRVILIGDVQSVKAQWDADHQTINTYVKVNVTRLLKGQLQNQTIVFKQLGGRVGDEATVIFGAPEYSVGQHLLLFLDTRQDGTLRVAHLFQGKYDVIDAAGQLRVKRQVSRDDVNILGVTQAPNITNDAPLARFTKKVKRVLRDYADTVAAYEVQHAATPIVEVPAEYVDAADQAAGDVSAQYTFLGSYRWFEPDSNQPVTFRVNSSGAPTASGGVTEINQAFAAWTAVQTTALTLQNIGSTTAVGFQQDGVSALSFNDPLDQMSDPVGCSGTLALGGVTSAGGGSRIIGGQSFSHIFEGDVVFNRNFSCFLGISANLAEVATHEIGHAIGFGHSADANAIMYATAHGGGRGATLGTDDIAAVTFLYPGSKGGTSGTNSSAFEWQLLPFSMTTGQTASVQVTFRNTGTTTWVPGTYYLGSQNPQDNTTWGVNRVNLPFAVAPGAGVIFTF